jgi:sigma-B regulation protein RsbU (phosphoserine phosphatase)
MTATRNVDLRAELLDWRDRLNEAINEPEQGASLTPLLNEVGLTLERLEKGTYGVCEICHEPLEDDLKADPLARVCLSHLTSDEQRALEDDLVLVARVQSELLPKASARFKDWVVSYHYEAAGTASGDYCDLIDGDNGDLYLLLGDVSGKGIAASMLMSHLNAIFRSLISVGLPLKQLVERANKLFAESTMPAYYATLVCGRATTSGDLEVCNAGHCPPLIVRKDGVNSVEATGLPIGMFAREEYSVELMRLEPGDTFVVYTDGLSEARDGAGAEYGIDRLVGLLRGGRVDSSAQGIVSACLHDLRHFRNGVQLTDDLTMMALQRAS